MKSEKYPSTPPTGEAPGGSAAPQAGGLGGTSTPLLPAHVFSYFREINAIPRPSKHEERMTAYLQAFAGQHGLPCHTDQAGNVLISKPATHGKEGAPGIILQAHMDMVCEQVAGLGFDFLSQPIETETEGEWMRAKGTTLGADDGIGVAMAMAALTDGQLVHGPLQCLFTTDEETGLTGASALESGWMQGSYLINLDSEDEGEIFVGCAGGANTVAEFISCPNPIPPGYECFRVGVSGLKGGHSGDDINKRRANAIKLLARFLYTLWPTLHNPSLHDIQGGNLHNAIPRDAWAIIAIRPAEREQVRAALNVFAAEVEREFHVEEPAMEWRMESMPEMDGGPFDALDDVAPRLLAALQGVHNGVLEMNQDIPDLVETSSNLASIKVQNDEPTPLSPGLRHVLIETSQRSSSLSGRHNMSHTVAAVFTLAGADRVETSSGYPGWQPNLKSHLLQVAVETYRRLFGKEPKVRAIHAGLECGLFSEKYPGLDMISIGPTMRGVHSPDERLHIPTVQMVWTHLAAILAEL